MTVEDESIDVATMGYGVECSNPRQLAKVQALLSCQKRMSDHGVLTITKKKQLTKLITICQAPSGFSLFIHRPYSSDIDALAGIPSWQNRDLLIVFSEA